jgi:hypothetical protein
MPNLPNLPLLVREFDWDAGPWSSGNFQLGLGLNIVAFRSSRMNSGIYGSGIGFNVLFFSKSLSLFNPNGPVCFLFLK